MRYHHTLLFFLIFLFTGCDPRGITPSPSIQKSIDTAKKIHLPHTKEQKIQKHIKMPVSEEKASPHKSSSTLKDQKERKHSKHKKTLKSIVKEIPKTIKKIPVINEIPKALPDAKEIPIVNKIAEYLSQRPGRNYRRLGKYAALVPHKNVEKSKPKTDENLSKLFDYSQHFSGGLHYDETVTLKKIKISTGKEGHTYLKIVLPKITPYTVDYDPKHKQIIVLLNESMANRDNTNLYPPNIGLIQSSRLETSPQGTLLLFQLKQDAKINVLESYAPTYISIDITPMYPLFIGTPPQP